MDLTVLNADPRWFPPTSSALEEPNGLLAVGGDLSCQRLLTAYSLGVFPWYQDGQPILWWTPDPRMSIVPSQCHVSTSMKKWMRKCPWQVRLDSQFEQVIEACAAPRRNEQGTWITQQMRDAYVSLHNKGFCHSVEVFADGELVGGLYGVALGKIFFGESMFSRLTNASKLALIVLSRFLQHNGFLLLDCQVRSDHLISLGAQTMPRSDFEQELSLGITEAALLETQGLWHSVRKRELYFDGRIAD